MKKLLQFFLCVLFSAFSLYATAQCSDGPYGVMVNNTVFTATNTGEADMQGRTQYLAHVSAKAGDIIKLVNQSCGETWMVDLDPYGEYQKFEGGASAGQIVCKADGCYDFYIKLSYGNDLLYIGPGTNCSDDNGNGGNNEGGDGDCQDGPYGVMVNSTIIGAQATGEADTEGRTQYLAHVNAKAGDIIKLINQSCNATWMVDLDPYDEYVNFDGGAATGQLVCKKDGCYDFYIKLQMNNDILYIGPGTNCGDDDDNGGGGDDNNNNKPAKGSYGSQVPSQATDVMLQGFYYDSYQGKTHQGVQFSDTKWATLLDQASELGAFFDMVWLPPSAKASGTGYHPEQYSNQNSTWGSRAQLESLIAAFHASPRKTKVIADIVINHAGNKSTWCDYHELDFGSYGLFQPNSTWITSNDEVWTSSDTGAKSCTKGSNASYDDGYEGEANYAAARDWDHNQQQVRDMCKAYLKWMYNVMDYDGWRYDYCKGFHNSHINDYNKASGAYFSVMEYWDGNVNTLRTRLNDAGMNTMTFDFATKYEAFNRGIAAGNYAGCKGSGLLGAGLSKYAVTFIDSHDSFERDDNEMCGKGNSLSSANKNKVLQANAFLLSMPGIPCVFYPHWQVFKEEIGKMIMVRHATGVHSESAVSDEAGAGGYQAYVTGKNGMICLQLGNKVGSAPSGYTTAVSGSGFAVHYKLNSASAAAPILLVTPGSSVFKNNITGITVTIKTVTLSGNATIYYTTDGSEPTTKSNVLSGSTLTFKQTTTLKVMAVANGAQSETLTYTYTYKAPQDVNVNPITVRFAAPASWTKVSLWAWTKENNKEVNLFSAWPGEEISKDAEGWYTYTFPKGMASVYFIFNDGKKDGALQTSDLWTDEDVCYTWAGGAEQLLEDCQMPSTAIINIKSNDVAMALYPNPVHDVLNISTDQTITAAYVINITGQCMKTEQGNISELRVNDLPNGMYMLNVQLQNGTQATRLFIKD